jgi:transcriptional regulator with PAS, ATPase and Fis domain
MQQILLKAKKYAKTDSTILITGESGTGKELMAQSIHNAGLRKDGPFVAVNCAAISESLLESELFGYADGAFTGAKKGGKPGVFELAHGGTLFLDEIGEISTKIQAILLRVLQEKEIMRVGGDRMIPVDVRVIAATNKDLWESVQKGLFREDLFFRLNVLRLQMPSLRERKDDIPLILNRLLRQHKVSFLTWEQLPEMLKQFFLDYDWPGNIRQLENVVERMVLNLDTLTQIEDFIEEILYENSGKRAELSGNPLRENILPMTKSGKIVLTPSSMEEMEIEILEQMLKMYNNNRSLVADKLGISRTTLWKKLKDVSG